MSDTSKILLYILFILIIGFVIYLYFSGFFAFLTPSTLAEPTRSNQFKSQLERVKSAVGVDISFVKKDKFQQFTPLEDEEGNIIPVKVEDAGKNDPFAPLNQNTST